jgi:hypothetical protein
MQQHYKPKNMVRPMHYETVSEAINALREKGFTVDFNLKENNISGSGKYKSEDFEIVDVYRYEGDSDPGDEATVYALETNGIKGILVTGFGMSSDEATFESLKKMKRRKN